MPACVKSDTLSLNITRSKRACIVVQVVECLLQAQSSEFKLQYHKKINKLGKRNKRHTNWSSKFFLLAEDMISYIEFTKEFI
jgi:hypothetical protein